jgi:hypothetical protein
VLPDGFSIGRVERMAGYVRVVGNRMKAGPHE